MRIKTKFNNPPIPVNNFDWSAWDDETYDYDSPTGTGKTEQEAINDLINQIEMDSKEIAEIRISEINNKNTGKEYSLGDVLLLDKFEKELKDKGWTEERIKKLSPSYYNF